jgi:EAL domain-containing protein (putative c-di-GMP-specific phosphodiesterase class I)
VKSLNCDYAQGFLFSMPITADEAARMLDEDPMWE